jgi:hypothetical protein
MNDPEKTMPDPAVDKHLLEQLSCLRAAKPATGMSADLEARLLGELLRRRPGRGAVRFFRETLGSRWEPVLLSLLFVFLAWDLLRIIRYLLS